MNESQESHMRLRGLRPLDEPQREYQTLDQLDALELTHTDPDALVASTPITIDEVQRAPDLLSAIKRRIDNAREPGMFLLTGSANLALMQRVAESLAGRALYLELGPFCPLEWCGRQASEHPLDLLFATDMRLLDWPVTPCDWVPWLLRGGLPPALEIDEDDARALWLGGYVQTYLERDLRDLSQVASLTDFRRVMRLAAGRVARLLNQSELARDAAVKQPTAHRYLNLMETGLQISRLEVFATHPDVPIVKSKKLLFRDCGVGAWLAGVDRRVEQRPDAGFWVEQALFPTLESWRHLDPMRRHIHYWRDRRGNEVDFILQDGDQLVALEIKKGSRVTQAALNGLRAFRDSLPRTVTLTRSAVLHTGAQAMTLGSGILSLPMGCFFPPLS